MAGDGADVSAEELWGFYINQLYSSTVTPGELVIAYHRGLGDEGGEYRVSLQQAGRAIYWRGSPGHGRDDRSLHQRALDQRRSAADRRRPLDNDGRGPGARLGYISVVDWSFDRQPGTDIDWAAIGKLLWFGKFSGEEWGYLDELMREWQVLACVVDADPFTNDARRFAKKFHGYVWLTRYRRGQTAKEVSVSEEETPAPFATVDRTNWLHMHIGKVQV